MVNVAPCSQRFLRHERFHEDDRHDGVWAENLRRELAPRREVRLQESLRRLLASCPTTERSERRGACEGCNRPVRKSPAGTTWQEYLVDGRRRAHRVVS